jgi:hypothetical protein
MKGKSGIATHRSLESEDHDVLTCGVCGIAVEEGLSAE